VVVVHLLGREEGLSVVVRGHDHVVELVVERDVDIPARRRDHEDGLVTGALHESRPSRDANSCTPGSYWSMNAT
jgi:hypothetical protein